VETQPVLLVILILVGGGSAILLTGRWLRPRWSAWASLAVGLGAMVPLLLPNGPLDVLWGEWLPTPGWTIAFTYRFDALAQVFALLAAIPALLLLLWMGLGASEEEGPLAPWVLLLLALFLHLVTSADLLLTYAGWEALLLATYFLLTYRRAALPTPGIAEWFLGTQHLAGFALLFALLGIGQASGTWQYTQLVAGSVTPLALALLLGTVWVRMALAPLQGWALASAESPGPVSTLLLGSWLLLPGPYLWLRFLQLGAAHVPRDAAMIAGVVALLLGCVLALRQESSRRVQAGDTVARLGLVWIALGLDSSLGIAAGLFLLLDLLVGKVAFHLALSGSGPRQPLRQLLFSLGAWGAVGLPPSLGFVGRWLLVMGLIAAGRAWYIPFLLLTVPLTLAYLWRGWTLVPTEAKPVRRWETIAQYAIAAVVAITVWSSMVATRVAPAFLQDALGLVLGPSATSLSSAESVGLQSALETLAGWLPAWTLLLAFVAILGGWWSGALRLHHAPAPTAAPGPLQAAMPVLPRETGWLAWVGRPAPLTRLLARAAGFLAVSLHGLVNFLERHTTYFLLVVLVAAVVMIVVLTR
jgi:formate hydrogenlyase subunit 3/multisubunit Na+/H+ antiporter MnhD subunit